jgi:hypothetical protein
MHTALGGLERIDEKSVGFARKCTKRNEKKKDGGEGKGQGDGDGD